MIKLAALKKDFELLPKRWFAERNFVWASGCQRLTKDYKQMPNVLRGLHFVVFAILMLPKATHC